jgi:O-6-methylguanine DNA methyltransferase
MFKDKVLEVVKNIPKGKTLSYKEVATLAGSSKAYRAVGTILKQNQDTDIPCHRVIKANKTLGQYNRLQGVSKKEILIQEGVEIG